MALRRQRRDNEHAGDLSPRQSNGATLSPALRACLAELSTAFDCAARAGNTAWEFAVPVANLRGGGLSDVGLQWLLANGFAEHRWETTRIGRPQRSFDAASGGPINHQSCLVLTARGAAHVRTLPTESFLETPAVSAVRFDSWQENPTPVWDRSSATLFWQGTLVKEFTRAAPTQFALLDAWEKHDWSKWLDDPFPPMQEVVSAVRLREVVRRLNDDRASEILRFGVGRSGQCAYWAVGSRKRPARRRATA